MTGSQRWPGGLAGVVAVLAALGALTGCGTAGSAAVSGTAPVPAGETTQAPDLSAVSLPSFVMPQIKGSVSMPDPHLTPGSVVDTNTNMVCAISAHGNSHRIAWQTGQHVYVAYGDGSKAAQHKLNLNYLVPVDLGGGGGADNLWPVSLKGTGFYQKVETDHVLRDLVCHRALSLAVAQHDEETNWYAAWLRYVVATGSA